LLLGPVLPFLMVFSDPEQLWTPPLVQDQANSLGFTT
jgi:hypothetical protein